MIDIFDPNWIRVTYGNTMMIEIGIVDNDTCEPITLDDGEYIVFTVKSKKGEMVIEKILTSVNADPEDPTCIICEISSEETKLVTGEYLYDCLYVDATNKKTTFVSSIFQITPAVGVK